MSNEYARRNGYEPFDRLFDLTINFNVGDYEPGTIGGLVEAVADRFYSWTLVPRGECSNDARGRRTLQLIHNFGSIDMRDELTREERGQIRAFCQGFLAAREAR